MYRTALTVALLVSSMTVALPLADAFGMPKIFVALIGAGMLWALASKHRWSWTGLERPLALLAAAFALSTAFSIDSWAALVGTYSQPFLGATAIVPAVLILYATAAIGGGYRLFVLRILAVLAVANVFVVIGQAARLFPDPYNMVGMRALGVMGSPIFTGAVIATTIPASLYLFRRREFLGVLGLAAGTVGLMFCGSRGPILAALGGALATLYAAGVIRPRRWHLIGPAVALAALLVTSKAIGKAGSDAGRLKVWAIAARAGFDRPIGYGPDTFPLILRQRRTVDFVTGKTENQASAHNDILQAWATMGFLGALALVWLWAAALIKVWRSAAHYRTSEGSIHAPAFGALVALFIYSKFNPTPPAAVYIIAALVGTSRSASEFRAVPGAFQAAFARAGWALAALVFVPSAYLMAAEVLQAIGYKAAQRGDFVTGSNMIRMANEAAPREHFFAARRFKIIESVSPVYPEATRKEFARRALMSAAKVVEARPLHPSSHELFATVQIWAAKEFGPGLSRAAVFSARRAIELDPVNDFAPKQIAQAEEHARGWSWTKK